MFNNTDYAALIIAVVALISPVIVELLRNHYDKEKRRRDLELRKAESEGVQRREELLSRQKILLEYDSNVKEFYELLLLDKIGKSIFRKQRKQKNKIIDLFNKIIIEFNFIDRWKYSKDIKSKQEDSNQGKLCTSDDFILLFLNITDCIQDTVQQFCDDKDFDEIPLLKLCIELYQILLPVLFQNEDTLNHTKLNLNLQTCVERYKEQRKEREQNKQFLIKDYPSVSNYFETIFKENNNIFDFVMKKLEDVNQYRRIHKSIIDDKNHKNYVEIEVQDKSFHINKNCNRDVAERFIFDILKEMEQN